MIYVWPIALDQTCTECGRTPSPLRLMRITMHQCDVALCAACETTFRKLFGAPPSVCGAANVDKTTCTLVRGHDGNHYDGIGYWSLAVEERRPSVAVPAEPCSETPEPACSCDPLSSRGCACRAEGGRQAWALAIEACETQLDKGGEMARDAEYRAHKHTFNRGVHACVAALRALLEKGGGA